MRILAALILMLPWPVHAQGVAVTPDLQSTSVSVARIVEAHFPRTLALLAAEFPVDHQALLEDLAAIDAEDGTERELGLLVAQRFTGLRRKYADRLQFAPSAAHSKMMSQLAAFYEKVHQTEGSAVCGRFAADGSAVLFDLGLSVAYAEFIDAQSVAFFEAVVGAIERPEYAGAASQDDWSFVVRKMVEAGAPASFAATIAGGDPDDPDLCLALAAMFVATALLDTPEGARTRADFARNLTGY